MPHYRIEIAELRVPVKNFSDALSIRDKRRWISRSSWTNAN
jgi:hypothetical protein